MNPLSGLRWFVALKSRAGLQRREPDLGNMGIASGLDAAMPSLDEVTRRELQARGAPDSIPPPANRPTRPTRL